MHLSMLALYSSWVDEPDQQGCAGKGIELLESMTGQQVITHTNDGARVSQVCFD
jgi:hypothetical protein